MADKTVDGVSFDAAFLNAGEADRLRIAAEIEEGHKAKLAQAIARAPNDGAYAADGPAPPVQGALPMPPGFVGDMARFIYESALLPVPEVAITAALGFMAGICGKVWVIPKSGLNLYIVLVARSGIGKEALHDGISDLINAALPLCPVAGNFADFTEYASGPALLKACAQNQCFVNVSGEIGRRFLAMAANRDPSMQTLRTQMTSLYGKSAPNSITGGITYSSQENNVESIKGLRSGDRAALRALTKLQLTGLYLKRFTRASRRNDAEGLFWSSTPPTELIPLIAAGRRSPPAWIKKDVLVETVKSKNTYYPQKMAERGQRRMIAFANVVRKGMKRGEGDVHMKLKGTDVTAWNMMPNPKFELVVVNRFDKAALLKLLGEVDSTVNVEQWLKERTVRQGATPHKPLYADYTAWCEQRGETAAGTKNFAHAMIAAGVVKLTRSNAAQRYELELR